MKRILFIVLFALLGLGYASAQFQPEWITQKPLSYNEYTGVASAPLTTQNCREIARMTALNEIAAQISVNVEVNSFLNTTEINGRVKEIFERSINESLSAELSGVELVDSYETSERYYAYYSLDKDVYKNSVAQKIEVCTNKALGFLIKGKELEAKGELLAAMSTYIEGLKVVEPYLSYNLECSFEGKSVNVATELYVAYTGALNGMAITTNVETLNVESLSSQEEPIKATLSKNGLSIANVLMCAEFVSGDGSVTPPVKTDSQGVATFYVTNVTSKQSLQTIRITIDKTIISELPYAYQQLVLTGNFPMADVALNVTSPVRTAYFYVGQNDVAACESTVRSILTNNYFEVTDVPDADLFIEYSTTFRKGGLVDGELYQLRECYGSLSVKIYNNATRSLLAEYTLPDRRVLVAADKSESQMVQQCAREMAKQFKSGLSNTLSGIRF